MSALHWEIIRDIGAQVAHGGLRPGDQLPVTRTLMEEHGISSYPVDLAMKILEIQGIVRTISGKGRFVTEDAPRICKEKGY